MSIKIALLSQKSCFFKWGNFAVGTVIFIVITFLIIFDLLMHIKPMAYIGLQTAKHVYVSEFIFLRLSNAPSRLVLVELS